METIVKRTVKNPEAAGGARRDREREAVPQRSEGKGGEEVTGEA